MFKCAVLRSPCASMVNGLGQTDLGHPDYRMSLLQHEKYADALRSCSVEVIVLPAAEDYPDSCFVEDVALCTPHCAILCRPGAPSRLGEVELIAETLSGFYKQIETIEAPGTVEAGDIMMAGDHYYIGISSRTNVAGAEQMIGILKRYGMSATTLNVGECLHLKTGLTYLENNNLLITSAFSGRPELKEFNPIVVDDAESYAANSIWVNGRVIVPAGYPATCQKIAACGYETIEVDTSEFRKLDGGVSCLSLRF